MRPTDRLYSQVSELVRGDDDARESAGVLDDGHAVHLLEPLVDDARAAHVGEAGRPAVALTDARLAATHVEPAGGRRTGVREAD